METETDFTIAALRLEEKYTNVNNSELLNAFGFESSEASFTEELEANISKYISKNMGKTGGSMGAAVFALGKTFQDKYLSLFKDIMRLHLQTDLHSAYQAGIAIENLGISIFKSVSPSENPELTKQRITEFLENDGT